MWEGVQTVVPRPEGGPEGWGPEGWGPEGWGPEGWGPEGWGPEGWGPEGWGAQNLSLFSPLPPQNSFFSSLSGGFLVEFWWCLKRRGPEMCTFGVLGLSCASPGGPVWWGRRGFTRQSESPHVHISGPRRFKHHQNSTRKPPEREEKNEFCGGREKKKSEILGGPAEGGPGKGGKGGPGKGGPGKGGPGKGGPGKGGPGKGGPGKGGPGGTEHDQTKTLKPPTRKP